MWQIQGTVSKVYDNDNYPKQSAFISVYKQRVYKYLKKKTFNSISFGQITLYLYQQEVQTITDAVFIRLKCHSCGNFKKSEIRMSYIYGKNKFQEHVFMKWTFIKHAFYHHEVQIPLADVIKRLHVSK